MSFFRGPWTRRKLVWSLLGLLAGLGVLSVVGAHLLYPSDRTPEGAYYRVVIAVNRGEPAQFFAYLETTAEHACYTIRDYRRRARERVLAAYPEPQRGELSREHVEEATAADGADVFALYARRLGFMARLRKDLSGVARVEQHGERATVETARGTRYPFRRRPENGIWGLTLFTAVLEAEAERAARDYALIDKAAKDYERARAAGD
ncbi:MAG TPA: hypothetical protein VLJ38_20395 [Polyangiaceae bacterium]|jgi:hypothetical protein|nr:hypothetical protein [Polyangiaceae bacterium]